MHDPDRPAAAPAAPRAAPAAAAAAGMIACEDIASSPAFTRLSEVPGVHHDLRYAGTNNFSGRVLYTGLDCAWIRTEAARGLAQAAAWLGAQRPGWRLLVLDALRPQRIQEAIWADVGGTDAAQWFANPVQGSIHSFGMAVDVTLVDLQGREIDMGSGYDEMSPLSMPSLHAEHLALGRLGAGQLAARGWLHAAMTRGGFAGISNEWWHFDHGDRVAVRRELPRVW